MITASISYNAFSSERRPSPRMTFSLLEHHALLARFKFINWRYCQKSSQSQGGLNSRTNHVRCCLGRQSYGCEVEQNAEVGWCWGRHIGQYNRENVFSLKRSAKLQTKDIIFVWHLNKSVRMFGLSENPSEKDSSGPLVHFVLEFLFSHYVIFWRTYVSVILSCFHNILIG